MKKTISILLVLLTITLTFSACKLETNRFVGNWVCEEVHSGYPDQMTLNSDGTATVDGFSANWRVEDGTIYFNIGNALINDHSYNYEFDGSTLYLNDYLYSKV